MIFEGYDDEDMFDDDNGDDDTDDESDETDISDIPSTPRQPAPSKRGSKPRRLRVRPMTAAMSKKTPSDVVTITMTRADGRQVIFVRP